MDQIPSKARWRNWLTRCTEYCPSVGKDTLYKDFNLELQTVRIASHIDPAQSAQLRSLQLSDIFLEPRTWRSYPGGTLAAQILGYVQQNDQKSRGVYGIERQYDQLPGWQARELYGGV